MATASGLISRTDFKVGPFLSISSILARYFSTIERAVYLPVRIPSCSSAIVTSSSSKALAGEKDRMVNKRKIAYIVSNFPCYSETFVVRELLELKRRGYPITIFSLMKPKEEIIQEKAKIFLKDTIYIPFLSFGVLSTLFRFLFSKDPVLYSTLWEIVKGSIKNPLTLIKNLAIFPKSCHFAKIIKDKDFSHIHAHFGNFPATSALITSSLLKIPFTFTIHAHDIFYDTTFLGRKIEKAKKIIAISDYNKRFILERFPRLDKNKIDVIHCGLDFEKFKPAEKSSIGQPLSIVSVGRIVPTKGIDTLIKICSSLKDKNLEFICKIAGSGPSEKHIRRLIKSLHLERYVFLVGPKKEEEIIKLYQEADFFVLPVRREKTLDVQDGIPVTLIEAMSMGLIVISTPVSGIPELIDDGETGFLIEPYEYEKGAKIILKLIGDENLRRRIKEKARERVVQRFSLRDCVDRLEQVFNA